MCGKPLKDFREAEYHHKQRYIDGGKSEITNIAVLCKSCHDIIHGNGTIELPTEEEKEELE